MNAYELGAKDQREELMVLFGEMGEELMDNARGLAEFEGEGWESRARMFAGMLVHELSQILYTDARSEAFDKRFREVMRDIKGAIGPEQYAELMAKAELEIPDKHTCQDGGKCFLCENETCDYCGGDEKYLNDEDRNQLLCSECQVGR